jgi:threonyl-tRNA synthetase
MKKHEQLSVLRHSAAHIMAAAVKDIFPFSKIAIGPSTENGFYYDFDTVSNFTQNDLKKIEKKNDLKNKK